MSEFERATGFEGMGRYWRLLEFLSEHFDQGEIDVNFTFSRETIRELFRIRSWNKLQLFTDQLSIVHGITISYYGNVYEIDAPILLDLLSKDFKYNRKRIASNDPKNKSKNKSKIKDIPLTPKKGKDTKSTNVFLTTEILENLYARYPKKVGKVSGNEKLQKILKNEKDLITFEASLENYLELCKKEGRDLKYYKAWSAFVNNHLDYAENAALVSLNYEVRGNGQESKEDRLKSNLGRLWENVENEKEDEEI